MQDIITQCKTRATQAMEMFLRNLSHVPADKLDWSPSATSRSALAIAAHCAGYSHGFASVIREGKFPTTGEEFLAPIQLRINGISTIDEAVSMLRAGIEETLAALDTVAPDQVERTLDTPIGPTSFLFFMTIPATHLILHTGQIDYLQTCWGDQEVYF